MHYVAELEGLGWVGTLNSRDATMWLAAGDCNACAAMIMHDFGVAYNTSHLPTQHVVQSVPQAAAICCLPRAGLLTLWVKLHQNIIIHYNSKNIQAGRL